MSYKQTITHDKSRPGFTCRACNAWHNTMPNKVDRGEFLGILPESPNDGSRYWTPRTEHNDFSLGSVRFSQ